MLAQSAGLATPATACFSVWLATAYDPPGRMAAVAPVCCDERGRVGRLEVALVEGLPAAIGRDLRLQRTAEPVDLRLDLGGRVGILMVEHRQEIRQQAEHDADGPRLGDPLGLQAVVAELGERGEDGFTRGEVPQRLRGWEDGWKGIERGEGLPRPRLLFEGGQQLGHLGLQVVVWGVQLGREEGDERATGPHRVGEGERVENRVIAEDLLEHGIGPRFCGIQEGHSTFRGGQGCAARVPSPGHGCCWGTHVGVPAGRRRTGPEAPLYEAAWCLSQYSAMPGHMPGWASRMGVRASRMVPGLPGGRREAKTS